MRLRFMAVAGLTYSVLYRDDVEPGVWTNLADVPAQPITAEVEVIDSAGPARAQRYYRLVTP